MGKALFDDGLRMFNPNVAVKFGLNEAIILQQIHYWIEVCKEKKINEYDGFTWTYNSYTEWQIQFPFMSKRTIQRSIKLLEDSKVLVYRNYNKMKIDRTKWYTINYKVLELSLETEWFQPSGQNGTTMMTKWHDELAKLALPLPKNFTKNTAHTYDNIHVYDYTSTDAYFNAFKDFFGYKCRKIKKEPDFDISDYSYDQFYEMFMAYFDKYGTRNRKRNLEDCSIEVICASAFRYAYENLEARW